MTRVPEFERAAVIGSGVMGAAIAAHLAGAGLQVTLFDLKPTELTPREEAAGLTLDHPKVTRRIAADGLARAVKSRPPAFFTPNLASRVRVANLEDDLPWLEEADWVIEAIVENIDIKRDLYHRIAPYLDLKAVLSSNTSGLSVQELSDALPAGIRPRFLVSHFFNPPRFLHLLELVSGPETDPEVMRAVSEFGRDRLGKGIVVAKDTPNFIGNRVGVYALMHALHVAPEFGLDIASVDALMGPLIGRPKSATYRTADIVGLDTLCAVADNLADRLPAGTDVDFIRPPEVLRGLVEKDCLGAKNGRGFYTKSDKREILQLDPGSGEYVSIPKPDLPILAMASVSDLGSRLADLVAGDDAGSRFLWANLSATLDYAARCVPEICDDLPGVDNAMKWGFGWSLGPFEMWDALGVEAVVARFEKEGRAVPELASKLLARKKASFYESVGENTVVFHPVSDKHEVVAPAPRSVRFDRRCRGGHLVQEPAASRLVDLGEGVVGFEMKTKRNTITTELITELSEAVATAEQNWAGLVIGCDSEHFSAGANLKLVLETLARGDIDKVDATVREFQAMCQHIRYSKVPVVSAPRGQTLAGGCELVLAANRVCAAAETYIGLVEVGVGLIPAGGGCKEFLRRLDESVPRSVEADLFPWVRKIFELIGMARVASSAHEAKELGLLAANDRITMNANQVLHDARDLVLAEQLAGYRPQQPRTDIRVLGQPALATLRSALYNMHEGSYITDYDHVVADKLAWVLCGGDLSGPSQVSEEYILDLERQAFMELCQDERSQARMGHILETGKPLRN